MNAALEFHDSEVSKVEANTESLRVLFSAAYVHRSEGVPGVDNGEGYVQAVELRISSAAWKGPLGECIGKISDGDLFVADTPIRLVPLPFEATGEVRLEVQFTNGAMLLAAGTSVQVRQVGKAHFVERSSC